MIDRIDKCSPHGGSVAFVKIFHGLFRLDQNQLNSLFQLGIRSIECFIDAQYIAQQITGIMHAFGAGVFIQYIQREREKVGQAHILTNGDPEVFDLEVFQRLVAHLVAIHYVWRCIGRWLTPILSIQLGQRSRQVRFFHVTWNALKLN